MGAPASESWGSDATLQPQGTDWGQNASLPSFAQSPTNPLSSTTLSINNASSREPTPEQAQAIAVLKTHRNSDIIAWHTLSQSIEPGLRHQNGPGGLSILEIRAISSLRECSNESLLQWLGSCIYPTKFLAKSSSLTTLTANPEFSASPGLSASKLAAAALSRRVRRLSSESGHISGHPSVVNSVKASSPYLSSNPYSALTATQNHSDLRQTFPRVTTSSTPGFVKPAHPGHKYWCTVCDSRSFKQSDGWKKHEKEHEVKYVCMVEQLFEPTKEGRRCVLCGALNQADNHHLVHNIAPCVESTNRPFFKRRYDMVGHLKDIHAVCDRAHGGDIADKWRCKSSKSAWSCGFCVHLSTSLQEHLKHIGIEHFEKGQSIKDWKYSNIIQGLLLQPGINEAWINLLESLDPFRLSETKWNRAGSENLLYRLERGQTGKEMPQALAKAAYDSAEFDWSLSEIDITTSATTTDAVPNQYTGNRSSLSFQDHTFRPGEALVKRQPWSPPPRQVSQISGSLPHSEAQYAYGTAVLNSALDHSLPTTNQSPGWDALTSDTGDLNSTHPTTPYNDRPDYPLFYTPWSGYNITPNPTPSYKATFHYNIDYKVDWPTHPQSDIEDQKIGSTLKRSSDSLSPPNHALPCGDPLDDGPRKKLHIERSGTDETESRNFNTDYGQSSKDGDMEIRIGIEGNGERKTISTNRRCWL